MNQQAVTTPFCPNAKLPCQQNLALGKKTEFKEGKKMGKILMLNTVDLCYTTTI